MVYDTKHSPEKGMEMAARSLALHVSASCSSFSALVLRAGAASSVSSVP